MIDFFKLGFWFLVFASVISVFVGLYGYFSVGVLWLVYLIVFRKKILSKLKHWTKKYHNFFSVMQESFNYILILYLGLLLLQEFKLLMNLNANYLLFAVIGFGVVTVLFPIEKKEKQEMKWFDQVLVWVLGVLGVGLIYLKTQELGWLSYAISLIAGSLIVLVGYLIYDDSEDDELDINLKWKHSIYVVLGLVVISIIVSRYTSLLEGFRIVFGSVYVLFVPGFILSYVFFLKEIDFLERIALSFALSIAVVPLMVFYLNLIGMKINTLSVSLVILGVCCFGLGWIYLKPKVIDWYYDWRVDRL
jgi:hypothetical protein